MTSIYLTKHPKKETKCDHSTSKCDCLNPGDKDGYAGYLRIAGVRAPDMRANGGFDTVRKKGAYADVDFAQRPKQRISSAVEEGA